MPSDPSGSAVPTILVVDDHLPNLIALEAVLEPLGFALVKALSGQEALRRAEDQDFVLIVMDVQMPGVDGYETVEALRRKAGHRDVPVVFMTAVYDLQDQVHRGYALGAADYVTKPFDPVVLRAKFAALISLYQRGRREERMRREQVDLLKDLFLGAVGHDLRNPLHAIAGGTQLLLHRGASMTEEARHLQLERIARTAARMDHIVEDILDLTRGKFTGGIPLTVEDSDLEATCKAVIGEMQSAYPARPVELEVTGDTRGRWDAHRLGRVLANLVANALQHANDGPVRVLLDGDDPLHVSLCVHNQGPPIQSEVVPQLFEPFRRGDASVEGLGLGLYIVREIVRAHGGSVDVRSSAGEGTMFAVTLPREVERAASRAG